MNFATEQQAGWYAVEVSGWDASETFFVENTKLAWNANSTKEITLDRVVLEGSVIFVRLTQPAAASADTYPIACQAMKVVERGAVDGTVVQLAQLRPQAFFKDAASLQNDSAMKVA